MKVFARVLVYKLPFDSIIYHLWFVVFMTKPNITSSTVGNFCVQAKLEGIYAWLDGERGAGGVVLVDDFELLLASTIRCGVIFRVRKHLQMDMTKNHDTGFVFVLGTSIDFYMS